MSYSIEEMNANMTIFYYKSNGDIYTVGSGIQPIDTFFGEHSVDMALMLDEIVLPIDQYVLNNSNKLFKIDITKSPVILALIPTTAANTYPVATS